jgi:hypothetical protein
MNRILFLFVFSLITVSVFSQSTLPLTADTIKMYKRDGSPAELLLKNGTKDTIGFLFNTGDGKTVFRRGAIRVNDTTYLIGMDTLYIKKMVESDPFFTTSPAVGITNTNISNWNTAFGWGNHAGLYAPIDTLNAYLLNRDTTLMLAPYARKNEISWDDVLNKPSLTLEEVLNNGHILNDYHLIKTSDDGFDLVSGDTTYVGKMSNIALYPSAISMSTQQNDYRYVYSQAMAAGDYNIRYTVKVADSANNRKLIIAPSAITVSKNDTAYNLPLTVNGVPARILTITSHSR